MKTKKTVIAVLTVALLITAALIVGCIDPIDGISVKPTDVKSGDIKIPAGKAVVRIGLSEKNARTIFPGNDGLTLGGMFFQVAFTDDTTSTEEIKPSATTYFSFLELNDVPIVLTADTYTVVVTAFNNNAGDTTTFPIAGYTEDDVDITSAKDIDAVLIVMIDPANNGIFKYDITVPAITYPSVAPTLIDGYVGQLVIATYGGSQIGGSIPLTVGGNTSGSVNLPSGYYTATVTLSANNCQNRVYKNVLHVYPAMTSSYTASSLTAPNQNKFRVEFSLSSIADADGTFNTSSAVQAIPNSQAATDPGDPGNPAYSFDGWFIGNVNTGPAWTTAYKIFNDTNVFAKWTLLGAGATITVTFPLPSANPGTVTGNGTSFAIDDIVDDSATIEIALSGGNFSNIEWFWDSPTTSIGGGDTLTIDETNLSQLTLGTHTLTVTYTDDDDGDKAYSDTIEFVITK